MYCYLKSCDIDINIFFLNNDNINIYKYAKEYYLKFNKKKLSKKQKDIMYTKYYNLLKSKKFHHYISFQQLMYVLLNC